MLTDRDATILRLAQLARRGDGGSDGAGEDEQSDGEGGKHADVVREPRKVVGCLTCPQLVQKLKARQGKIPNMTGVNSPYEAPLAADITLRTQETPLAESVRVLRERLESPD
jgi:hypothetical protein